MKITINALFMFVILTSNLISSNTLNPNIAHKTKIASKAKPSKPEEPIKKIKDPVVACKIAKYIGDLIKESEKIWKELNKADSDHHYQILDSLNKAKSKEDVGIWKEIITDHTNNRKKLENLYKLEDEIKRQNKDLLLNCKEILKQAGVKKTKKIIKKTDDKSNKPKKVQKKSNESKGKKVKILNKSKKVEIKKLDNSKANIKTLDKKNNESNKKGNQEQVEEEVVEEVVEEEVPENENKGPNPVKAPSTPSKTAQVKKTENKVKITKNIEKPKVSENKKVITTPKVNAKKILKKSNNKLKPVQKEKKNPKKVNNSKNNVATEKEAEEVEEEEEAEDESPEIGNIKL